jgi:hypothetical protein
VTLVGIHLRLRSPLGDTGSAVHLDGLVDNLANQKVFLGKLVNLESLLQVSDSYELY